MAGTPLNNLRVPPVRKERTPHAVYREISETWVALADLYKELGRSISEERRARGLTQAALADCVNLSREMVATYESGIRWKRDVPAIEKIVRFLEDA